MNLLNFLHLGALGFSLVGMVVLDARFRLFFFRAPARAGAVMVVGVAFFLLWDAAGIVHGIFLHGVSDMDSGLLLAPELPVEEVVFLTFLCYLNMNLYTGLSRLAQRRAARATPDGHRGTDA